MVVHASNINTWEVEGQSYPWVSSDFEVSLGNMRPFLKKNKNTTKQKVLK